MDNSFGHGDLQNACGSNVSLQTVDVSTKASCTWYPDIVRVQSDISITRPQTHRLPVWTMWLIVVVIAVGVAVVNNFMVQLDARIIWFKFDSVQAVMDEEGALVGTFLLAGFSATLVLFSALLVCYVAPVCAGSGLPEAKGYLNGNDIPDLFGVRSLCVRVIGVVLSVGAGLPIGREGPMVCIGGCIGYGVTHFLALRHVKRWVKTAEETNWDLCPAALIIDTERFAHAKRIGCALGGAAGIATAFNAPIGGILYMFEEVTVESWAPELTLRAFVCTVISALMNRALLQIGGTDVHTLVIYRAGTSKTNDSWGWPDVPWFAVVALLLGVFSAIFTRVLLKVFTVRRQFHTQFKRMQPFLKISEVLLFAVVCSFAWGLMPSFAECVHDVHTNHHDSYPDVGHGDHRHSHHHRRLDDAASATTGGVQYTCSEGDQNEVAMLLLNGAEGAIKKLYARDNQGIGLGAVALAFCAYAFLACGIPGLPVPMGLFVPSMLMGGLAGRFCGETLHTAFPDDAWASPGVYALVGSAAMLSGFTHMTIAIVVLLVEASSDLQLIAPLMLSIFTANLVSSKINHHGYDEVLILKKGVPFLDAELPHEMDMKGVVARDLCDLLPDAAILSPSSTLDAVEKALEFKEYVDFPVVVNGACVGMTTRSRLEAALQARSLSLLSAGRIKEESMPRLSTVQEEEEEDVPELPAFKSKTFVEHDDRETNMSSYIRDMFANERSNSLTSAEPLLQVHRIMDTAPHLLLEDMPVARFYNMFTRAGCYSAVVVSSTGDFVGILTREHLISSTRTSRRHIGIRRLVRSNSTCTNRSDEDKGDLGDDEMVVNSTAVGSELETQAISTTVSLVSEVDVMSRIKKLREELHTLESTLPVELSTISLSVDDA